VKWLKDLKLENSRQRKAVSWRRHYNVVRPHASLGNKPACTGDLRARLHRVAGLAVSTGSVG